MNRYHFIIIGSGWRAMYYVRIAKALPERFCLDAMLCRTQEKADRLAAEYGIHTTVSREECAAFRPDFAVIAVSKPAICAVSMEWMERGITVLSETPAALSVEDLQKLYAACRAGRKQVVAEQYREYASHKAALRLVQRGILGTVSCVNVSLAHDYHGISLLRAYLGIGPGEPYTVSARAYLFPTTETLSRYEKITDGRVTEKRRCTAVFTFENGRVAWYDFDSEQYRSPIRKNTRKVQGTRGEIIDDMVYYLDEANAGCAQALEAAVHTHATGDPNPNLAVVHEIERIRFGEETLYEAPFGVCGLSEDETAMAFMMEQTGKYSRGEAAAPYRIEDALADAYGAILLQQAVETGEVLRSRC